MEANGVPDLVLFQLWHQSMCTGQLQQQQDRQR